MDTEATIHDLTQRLETQERLVGALLARLGSGDVTREARVEPEARSRREVLSRAGAVVVSAAAVTASVVRASPVAPNFDGTSVSASTNNFGGTHHRTPRPVPQ